ncbi:Protein SIEL [Dichanthelium oligosanthes]|uniref:Protein SIEL n=1 Tax=Dichanthelium oligosanthes TaxID=888268 RepID=A0A1E5UIX0_9POAL|nr:Protein SIEL [Dichanthelium oligosanthes]
MAEPRQPSSAHPTAAAVSTSVRKHPVPVVERLAASDPGPSFAKRPRVAAEPPAPGGSAPYPEAEVRSLFMMAGGIYPLARAEALRGLAAVLEKVDASCGVGARVVECCYECAAEHMRDDDEGVRLAVVRLVGLCAQKFAGRMDVDAKDVRGDHDVMDLIFLQLSSMARDMCTKVRIEAFGALGKMQRVSEGVLLQSLSKKVIKTDPMSGSIINGQKLPPKLQIPCAAGIFAHGIEDEFYQVRTAACTSLGVLTKFSSQYAERALDLLMDMMNDDTEAVRLQTLQALFHMATYGYLSMQEKHMHMFLGLLVDGNALIRNAAHKILGLVNLPKLQMFKSAVDGLITSLEKNPEEQDIYGILFSIGKNHGSFSANIAKHLAKEIAMASGGELILDKPRIKALLMVSISAPFSDDKHKKLDTPSIIFSHAIPLLGKVSCALGEEVNQDSLLSYLCHKGGMPFWGNRSISAEFGESDSCKVEPVEVGAQIENTAKPTKCLDRVLVMRSMESILQTVEGAWTTKMSCNICDAQTHLRTCKEEVKVLAENYSGSIGAFLSFLCEYLDAIRLTVEIWQLVRLDNSYTFGLTSHDILLEKLDISVRRMEFCYAGLNSEFEVQVLELSLLANLFGLSKIGACSKVVLGKLLWVINRLEGLSADGSCELSDFSREIKKALDARPIGDSLISNIHTLFELFRLKPTANFGMLKEISAVLQVCDNNSENPLPYICGLPVGVNFNISLWNISSHHRLWLRMSIGESVQHTFLELSSFEGNEEVKSGSMVVPLDATPMAHSFVLRVCLLMECSYEGMSTNQGGHGGPSDCVVQLSDELDVYFVSTGQR